MAKNTDPQTLALFQAVKAAYFKHIPGTIRNNADGRPVSVDMMDKILNGRPIDGITIAEDTDTKQVIDIMPGYRCSLQALPRIYKGVARLAGETAEKIQMAKNTLPPFGILPQMATAKENKKAFALIKKYCKPDTIRPYFGYVFHDPARRWFRIAAVFVPLLVVVSFLTASAQTPAATITTATPPQPDTPARVITLPAVTITDTATTTTATETATAEPQPAPITLPAVTITDTTDGTPSSQKTATADTPSSQKTDTNGTHSSQKTDTATDSPSHTITLCAGTAWQYTMTQYA